MNCPGFQTLRSLARLPLLLALFPAVAFAGGADEPPASLSLRSGFGGLEWSPDGARLAMSEEGVGVQVWHRATGEVVSLTEDVSAGYRVRWSADGQRIAFKLFVPAAGHDFPLQVPVVYDFARGAYLRLATPSERAGVPSFARDGRILVTVETTALLLSADGQTALGRWDLGEYANLTALSPNGQHLAWTTDGGLWLMDLATGQRDLASTEGTLFDPRWSPDGTRLLVSEASGGLRVLDLPARRVHTLPRAASSRWMPDGQTVLFETSPVPDGEGTPLEADLMTVRYDGSQPVALSATPGLRETSPALSADGRELAFRSGDRVVVAPLSSTRVLGALRPLEVASWRTLDDRVAKAGAAPPALRALATKEISGVPYIHQVYDTPDNFNGHWACGPTSAMMSIAYRGILPNWDTTCSSPSSHVSHWGRYISQVYTKGRKFDISAPTASGVGYGGYGYIRNPNGFDTKGHMAEYFRYHGMTSSVDWSPTWGELQGEVNAGHPFVILTTITSSGHFKTIIGYATAQHTMVLNDPYGNKASGYMNYAGKRVFYDWPGYNNGFPSVNSVACFVTSRYTVVPTTGVLKGTVYKAPTTTAYLAGATVSAGGKSATTNASGAFSLTVPAGTHTVTVKASGYQDASVSKAVTAGGTTTVNVGLYASVVTGNFKGVVYEYNPANPSDMTKKLTSAQVSLDGGAFQAVRATDAYFLFATKPGPHTVKAKLAGYTDNSSTATVVGGADVWASVGLSKTSTQAPPKLHLESPQDGAWLDETTFDLIGSVENSGGVSEVTVTAGEKTFKGPLASGRFEIPVTVAAGKTTLTVKAANSAGSDTKTLSVNFKTGLCGIVSGAEGALPGAAIALLPLTDACAAALATATAGADGRFCVDAEEGSYLLQVKAAGHTTVVDSLEVGATARETVEITLSPGTDPAPTLTVVGPEAGADGKAHVAGATVTLSWRTAGLLPVETTVNGTVVTPTGGENEGDTLQIVAGLPLSPGENTFEIKVKGQCGLAAATSVVVVREESPVAGPDAGAPATEPDAGSASLDGGPQGKVDDAKGGCGCGASGAALPLVGLLALAGLRRRRR